MCLVSAGREALAWGDADHGDDAYRLSVIWPTKRCRFLRSLGCLVTKTSADSHMLSSVGPAERLEQCEKHHVECPRSGDLIVGVAFHVPASRSLSRHRRLASSSLCASALGLIGRQPQKYSPVTPATSGELAR